MLVHTVSLCGVAAVGSKDIMAVSRAWGHSFAGLRRLHFLRPISFSGTWSRPPFEPIVQQSPAFSRHVRFIAQAAALEDSSDVHQKRGLRLSRAERYALVENFVVRHKEAHEGKWPSVNAIVKEIGGSRVVVKDIVEELEKNSQGHSEEDGPKTESNGSTKPQAREPVEALSFEYAVEADSVEYEDSHSFEHEVNDDKHHEGEDEAEATPPAADVEAPEGSSPSILSAQTVESDVETPSRPRKSSSKRREGDADPGLWRRLRDLGQQESQTEPRQENGIEPLDVDDYFDEEEDDDDDDEDDDEDDEGGEPASDYTPEMYRTFKEATRKDGSDNHTKSASAKSQTESSFGESYGMFIRFLPLAATEADLRASYQECGEIVRAQAMVPKGSGLKFTYGFVDFSTPEALSKALKKDKVQIRGSTILTEACSGARRTPDTRPASVRKQAAEHHKKSETYRSSDARPANGGRSSPATRLHKSLTGTENGSKSSSNGSYLVAVEGLPYPMPISAVEKMLSAHGSISRSELAREDGGTYSAHVEFKTEEARDSALASSRVYLGGRWCRITTGEPILTTVVRLSNVGNATESFILQRCAKVGRVDNIVQRKEGVVDVYYHPTERRNMRKILDRLGDVNADFKRWHANLAPKCTLEEIRNSAEIQDWVEVQKDRLLDNLTGAMKSMLVDLEDLRELVDAERRDQTSSGKSRNFDRSTVKPHRS